MERIHSLPIMSNEVSTSGIEHDCGISDNTLLQRGGESSSKSRDENPSTSNTPPQSSQNIEKSNENKSNTPQQSSQNIGGSNGNKSNKRKLSERVEASLKNKNVKRKKYG